MTPQEIVLVDQKIEKTLKKDAIRIFQIRSKSFPQLNICVAPKGLRSLPSDKFEKFQSLHFLLSFQNGRVICAESNITGSRLHVQIVLRDAYFSVQLNQKFQKFVSFKWKDLFYQFLCFCFGLGPIPRIFKNLIRITIFVC